MQSYYMLDDTHSLWEVFNLLCPSFYAGSAIKYIVRCERKHALPLSDMEKAIDYLEQCRWDPRFIALNTDFGRLDVDHACDIVRNATLLKKWQKTAILQVIRAESVEDVTFVVDTLKRRLQTMIQTDTRG